MKKEETIENKVLDRITIVKNKYNTPITLEII